MLRSIHDPVRPIASLCPSPASPRDGTVSPVPSPRPATMSPRFESRPPNRPASASQFRQHDATADNEQRHPGVLSATHDPKDNAPADKSIATPLQSYHSPFASYTWSQYKPGSKEPPLLFVQYRDYPRSELLRQEPESRLAVRSPSPSTLRKRSSLTASSSSPYLSLSAVTASSNNLRERNTPYPRPSSVRQSSGESITLVNSERVSPPGDRELQNTLKRLDINAQSHRARRRTGGSPPWPYSSESESSCGQSPGAQGSIGANRHSTVDPEADEWMRHAKALEGGGSSAQYACTWVDPRDDFLERPCGYVSKKHLVKRHIESKHLQIKPITCEVCGKGFSQRTNYSTHMNTHTGAAPHKCPFEGCNATFGDPARRHRHMKAVHDHKPSKRRTQSDNNLLLDVVDVSEPEEEDSP